VDAKPARGLGRAQWTGWRRWAGAIRRRLRLWKPSLRTRLRVSILLLVTGLVVVQSVIMLQIAARAAFRNAQQQSESILLQVRTLLLDRLNQEIQRAEPPPATLEESKAIWTRYLQTDPSLPVLLEKLMAASPVTLEIQVCDERDRVLVSSIQAPVRHDPRTLPDFIVWNRRPLHRRLLEVLSQRSEYGVTVPLGVPGRAEPLYKVRVIVSSVLLRNELLPQIRALGLAAFFTLLAAVLLSVLSSNAIVSAFDRLARAIDLIRRGEADNTAEGPESEEVAAVRSKLNLLGQEFRTALQVSDSVEHLLRSVEAGVLMFGPDQRLLLASQPVERILGVNPRELVGRLLSEIFPDSTPLGQIIQGALELGRGFRDRLVMIDHPNGVSRRLLVSLEPVEDRAGHLLGTVVSLRDLESKQRLETQLEISTRLAAINRLTSGVAHEIKNPLNAIALYLEILKAKLAGTGLGVEELGVIEREIGRLDRVVKTFLDFTRPVELKLQPVDLKQLAREILSLVKPEAQKRNVELNLSLPPQPAMVHGDRDLLQQALVNVVVNGIEAMASGGRLEVMVRHEDDAVVLEVRDQGPGIPEEIQDKIFNLYFTTKPGGTGMGLAMTYRVVQLHNGSIRFHSRVGEGTTFELRFPATPYPDGAWDGGQARATVSQAAARRAT